jgi:hypothetical protein
MSEIITIDGKSYKYCGWAICTYEFLANGIITHNYDYFLIEKDHINEIKQKLNFDREKVCFFISVLTEAKKIRIQDFMKITALQFVTFLKKYEKNMIDNGYIPEITSEYILEFANSHVMQCDPYILQFIIDDIKKIYDHICIKYDTNATSENTFNIKNALSLESAFITDSMEEIITKIEAMQKELIDLFTCIV